MISELHTWWEEVLPVQSARSPQTLRAGRSSTSISTSSYSSRGALQENTDRSDTEQSHQDQSHGRRTGSPSALHPRLLSHPADESVMRQEDQTRPPPDLQPPETAQIRSLKHLNTSDSSGDVSPCHAFLSGSTLSYCMTASDCFVSV